MAELIFLCFISVFCVIGSIVIVVVTWRDLREGKTSRYRWPGE